MSDAASAETGPFFMFAASKFAETGERQRIEAVLSAHLTARDFVSLGLTKAFPALGARIPRENVFVLPPNLTQVAATIRKGTGDGTPGLLIYDGEHWEATPGDEQGDLPGAVLRGKALTRKSAGHRFGFAPDGIFVGVRPARCGFDLNEAVHRRVDWSDIALFNIQAQHLLSDGCDASGGFASFVDFVVAVAGDAKAAAPHLLVTAQLSFRDTPPDRMVRAIRRLRGIVDGFYVAYPSNVGPVCRYCSPENLGTVLNAIRGAPAAE
ncbi:MAG TPA: hypothetical protein VKS60_14095 [Stellaceae bacterium]|nr:hypothetical protein [Stellaceae bacterium]